MQCIRRATARGHSQGGVGARLERATLADTLAVQFAQAAELRLGVSRGVEEGPRLRAHDVHGDGARVAADVGNTAAAAVLGAVEAGARAAPIPAHFAGRNRVATGQKPPPRFSCSKMSTRLRLRASARIMVVALVRTSEVAVK